jgi:signal transduction histidine kinase
MLFLVSMTYRSLLLIAILLCSFQAWCLQYSPPDSVVTLAGPKDFIALNLRSVFLKDKTGSLTINDVAKLDTGFYPIPEEMYALQTDGYVPAYWVKFRINNITQQSMGYLVCLQPGVDSVQQYVFNPDSSAVSSSIGSNQATRSRYRFISHELVLPLQLHPGITTVYLRLINRSRWSQQRANIILSLAEERSFINFFLETRFYQGGTLGMLFLILILHIFISLFSKDGTYLIYTINLVITLVYLLLRKNFHLEFDSLSLVFPFASYWHDPGDLLLTITAVWFSQGFLSTKAEDPLVHKIMDVVKVILALGLVVSVTGYYLDEVNLFSLLASLTASIVILIAAIRSYRRGNRLSIYVFFGFVPLTLIAINYMVPGTDYLHFRSSESDLHYLAEALRAIIFSIGIADRFYHFKKAALLSEVEKDQMRFEQEKQIQKEKERISRDLHDNIGSQLAVLSLELESLSKEFGQNSKIDNARENAHTVIQELRDTVWAIESNQVTFDDIESKLNSLMLSYRKRITTIEFNLYIADEIKQLSLKPSQAINIYRIIQEAMQNSVKHSGCARIDVRFIYSSPEKILTVTINDDGAGFVSEIEAVDGISHRGIKNMKKRAAEINAEIDIVHLGYTEVSVAIPVSDA